MSRIGRMLWSRVLTACVVVAETSPGQVVGDTGSITQSGATTSIHQAIKSLSLNWKSFNIAPTETVNFMQPSAPKMNYTKMMRQSQI